MVALLWSAAGRGGRSFCGAGDPGEEAGLPAPLVGDKDVYEAAATCNFDFVTYAVEYAASFLLCSNDMLADLYATKSLRPLDDRCE